MSVWVCGGCGVRYAVGAPCCPHCTADQPTDGNTMIALPSLTVACTNNRCRHQGVARRVMLPQIVPGVLAVPELRCAGCGNVPPTVEGGNNMPKITAHGGVSNAAAEWVDEHGPELLDLPEGTTTWPGTSSSTSSKKDVTSPQPSEPGPSRPARTTGSRSKKGQAGSSARGTGGGPTVATSASDQEDGSGASDTA